MQDTELYQHLLGLSKPWTISRVALSLKEQQVDIWVDHPKETRFACPDCGMALAVYDHAEERCWRHLDSCQFMTILHARVPRIACPEHGVQQAAVSWAEPWARFTTLFERLAIDVLRETDVLGATRILRISWDEAWHILERAVARGQLAKEKTIVTHLGVDEKAAAKGHQYVTVVCDLNQGTVEYVGDDRKQESLETYFATLSAEQKDGIEAVAMDMWEPFVQATRAQIPQAEEKIVFDRYHIMTHMGKAVDDVRKQEHRGLQAEGDETLKGSKYLWLYAQENLPNQHRQRFRHLRSANLKTGRAWAIKECLRDLWEFTRLGWAKKHWRQWYHWATHSQLTPVVKAAKTIQRHLGNILTYFRHRITNAASEGINSKIQTLKKRAYGYRNRDHFKTAIYFHCGGLQLYPATHEIPG
jgi:transposase